VRKGINGVNWITKQQQTTRGRRRTAAVTAFAVAVSIGLPHAAHAQRATPPRVPDKRQVPEGSELFLVGHATGTQNYVCAPKGTGVDWSLFTPEATLFKDLDLEHQGGDHFSQTAHVQRLNTAGGLAPSTGCLELKDLGNRALMPYTADYLFYTDPAVTNPEHN
jgi:hypothetical protein